MRSRSRFVTPTKLVQPSAMLSSLRSYTSKATRLLRHVRRYSTPIDATPRIGETSGAPGALRPHLNIPVNPNHGLYAFFRKREKDGKVIYDSLEDNSGMEDVFGEWQHFSMWQPRCDDLRRSSLVCGRAPKKKLQRSPHFVVRSSERA